jgi:CDP-paratose 2-epimerase
MESTKASPRRRRSSLYGATKLASECLALEYGESFGFPVWINRCGVLAGAGQFGRTDQGILAFRIHSWRERSALRYLGFGGHGYQVRDALHPRDLVPVLQAQTGDSRNGIERIQNLSGGANNALSLLQLSNWCESRFGEHSVSADPQERPNDLPWVVLSSARAHAQWGWRPQTGLEEILEEIADHAESHPDWLRLSQGH